MEGRPDDVDVLVVGAGPGGYTAAIRAAQLGKSVGLAEKDAFGGTCLNYGCIPSKAMITASDIAFDADTAEQMGIYADPTVQLDEMVDWKDDVVGQLTGGVEDLCRANGVELLEGEIEFIDETHARLTRDNQNEATIAFENCIISSGSRPITVPGFSFEDDPVLNSRQALSLEDAPEQLVIVGAGYIGMELAGVFAKLGVDVTVIEMLDSILPTYDDELVAPVRSHADELGIEFHFGEAAKGWEASGDGITVQTETQDGDLAEYPAENVLVAVGRSPVTDTLGLDNIGLDVDENGFIETDAQCRTSIEHIFAVGDVAGEPLLAHKASDEGKVAAEVTAGEPSAVDYQAMPAVVFTEPEISTVGLSAADAAERDVESVVGQFPFQASGRALTTGDATGFVRVVAHESSGVLLGGQIVGPDASELVAELALAIEVGATLEDVARTIHAHPTLSEAVMEASEHALGEAIHTLNN